MPIVDAGTRAPVTARSARRTDTSPAPSSHSERDAEVAALFTRLRSLPEGDSERDELRERVAEHYLSLARSIASRYAHRGEPQEDLEQAALLGLVKAINGFDPDLGHDFIAYAMPMMTGEVKRHFRDRTWAVRVPRRHQERRTELNQTIRRLTQSLGRSPTTRELAAEMRMSVDDLSELMEASAAYSALSLDSPAGEDESAGGNLGDTLGGVDTDLESVVDRESLPPLLNSLPERERRIVLLRFFGNKTQSQIAEEIGVSQMHVSRLLSAALARLREGMLGEE
ncbi:SigB/SigF/SigG family RNA polymerase sigma factor [Marinactinospora rubrisoli]|uniref:SigB/SigF/SigG family RNA polymerase sigma factor n=1 Tax=Marinactinospora rubrisoli TaxID=2715399 RepID=A0ABW2KAK4_9ACTN